MCFVINENAKPWARQYVYKVVFRDGSDKWESLYYSGKFRKGKVFRSSARKRNTSETEGTSFGAARAKAGLYVYRTLKRALAAAIYSDWCVVRFQVDPADFLFAGIHGDVATYRKALCLGEVRK
jgi:hypothetical protein